jgi:hypothetical protein
VKPRSLSLPPDPLLSVITPAYNVEPYLPACIDSVLSQTLGNWELIIVDDGSTDGTADVIARYSARDRRVHGFRGRNNGVSHARNVALRHARGKYFTFLDADDVWEPAFAATLIGVIEKRPEISIVTGNAVNLGGGVLDGRPVRPWPDAPREIGFLDLIEHEDALFIMSVFRREVYETIGGFNESLHRSEDYEFWLRASAAGFRVLTHPEPLGKYRRRADSATADQAAMIEGIMTVLNSARSFRQRARADELGAIDRQLERMSAAHLLSKGKSALLRHDFVEARSHFWELYRRGKGFPFAAVSLGLRVAPRSVLRAYRARLHALERPIAHR